MLFRQSPRILLSYRRADTKAMAGRLADHLRQRFGADSVFIDVDNIPYGTDFRDHIRETIGRCDVVLALIGPDWSGSAHETRRIAEPEDHLRIEIETALRDRTTIIPVLVDDARMPSSTELPPSIARLAFLNAAPLDSGRDFEIHTRRIADAIVTIAARKRGGPGPEPGEQTGDGLLHRLRNLLDRLRTADPRRFALTALGLGVVSGGISSLALPYPVPDAVMQALPTAIGFLIEAFVFISFDKPGPGLWHPPYVFAASVILMLYLSSARFSRTTLVMLPVIVLAWTAAFHTARPILVAADGPSFKMSRYAQDQKCYASDTGTDRLSPEDRNDCDQIARQNAQVDTVNGLIQWITSSMAGLLAGLVGATGTLAGLAYVADRFRNRDAVIAIVSAGTLAGLLLNAKIFVFFSLPSSAVLYICWQGSLLVLIARRSRRTV